MGQFSCTYTEAAQYLGTSRTNIYDLVAKRKLEKYTEGSEVVNGQGNGRYEGRVTWPSVIAYANRETKNRGSGPKPSIQKKAAVLDAIIQYWKENALPPDIRTITDMANLSSVSSTYLYMDILKAEESIHIVHGKIFPGNLYSFLINAIDKYYKDK